MPEIDNYSVRKWDYVFLFSNLYYITLFEQIFCRPLATPLIKTCFCFFFLGNNCVRSYVMFNGRTRDGSIHTQAISQKRFI